MPTSAIRRRMFAAAVIATILPVGLSGCSVVEQLQGAGDDLKRRISEALGGDESVSDDGDTGIFTLEAGDCINDAALDAEVEAVASLDAADCGSPHDSEVIGLVDIDSDEFPGQDAVVEQSESLCLAIFETWTGGDYDEQPDLEFGYYTPTESGWQMGDTTTMCTAYAAGQMTGTTKGAATGRAQLTIGAPIEYPGWNVFDDGNTRIADLTEGQCVDDATLAADSSIDEVRSVDVVDCALPHDTEVLGVASISNEAYMSDDDTVYSDAVHAACVPLFEAWTGGSYDDVADLDYGYYVVPTIKSSLTSYEGACVIYRLDAAQITGTTRGAAAVGA